MNKVKKTALFHWCKTKEPSKTRKIRKFRIMWRKLDYSTSIKTKGTQENKEERTKEWNAANQVTVELKVAWERQDQMRNMFWICSLWVETEETEFRLL